MTTRIDAQLLIPGKGDPIPNASVVMEGNAIRHVGPTSSAPDTDEIVAVQTVMPGMWDCHAHFTGCSTPNLEAMMTHSAAEAGATETAEEDTREVFYSFTWAGNRGQQRRGKPQGKRDGGKPRGKGKPRQGGDKGKPRNFEARPPKTDRIDPNNPFAQALMGLKTKDE